jgi:hypothetical protein
MSKPGRPVDQTIRAGLSELGIRFTDENTSEGFYSIFRINGEIGGRKVVANKRTMNRTITGMVVI